MNGSTPVPPSTILDKDGNLVPNSAFQLWYQQDQLILSALISSRTPEILAHVINLTTSRDVWTAPETTFTSQSHARVIRIRYQLSIVTKKNNIITNYFGKVKNLADTLVIVG